MARKDGTGGRGGTGNEGFDASAFALVEETEELSRSRTAPSELQPLVDMAKANPNRKFERTDEVQATDENGDARWEMNDEGTDYARDEGGNPIPVMTRVPHVYKLEEAKKFAAELRNVGNRNRLPAKRLSLRIVADPPLAKATESDEIRVQFYIVQRTPQEQTS